jgi:N-formylglutamate amidohydrolase
VVLGVDCHTMAAHGPPVGPDPGVERPQVCLSDADGTLPRAWFERMIGAFRAQFEGEVAVNRPFRGGYIVRAHAAERPWIQVELSRAPFDSDRGKRGRVLAALRAWCAGIGQVPD